MISGSPNSDAHGTARGQARAYELDLFDYDCTFCWQSNGNLIPYDSPDGDPFGHGVAIDGDRMVIGAAFEQSEEHDNSGRVCVYPRNGGTWEPRGHAHARHLPVRQRRQRFRAERRDQRGHDRRSANGSSLPFLDLNVDAHFMLSLLNKPPFQDSVGLLGADGTGAGTYDLPPIGGIGFGLQVRHLALALDPSTLTAPTVTDTRFFFLEP